MNLASADLRKEGSALDLPIALGVLAASEQVNGDLLTKYSVVAELALNGEVRGVAGALPMAIAAREQKLTGILVPKENAEEAGVAPGIDVIPIETLEQAAEFVSGRNEIEPRKTIVAGMFVAARNSDL